MMTSYVNLFRPRSRYPHGSPLRARILTESACDSTEGYSLFNLGWDLEQVAGKR